MADVLELAHVAGERKRRESAFSALVAQHLRLDGEIARALLQEVPRERADVLASLGERRQTQAHDVQPVQEILAEEALLHALIQILVRRRDHAHVRLLRRVPADAVVLAVGKHAQQAHLQVRWHVADLVQEQRATLRLLEAAAA